MENCIRCKRKYELLVPLRPVSIRKWKENGKTIINEKYFCNCGCQFERTKML